MPLLLSAGGKKTSLTPSTCLWNRKRDHIANETLQEYLNINQVSAELEDRATKEEFDLMVGREELGELEKRLLSLRIQLDQRLQIP